MKKNLLLVLGLICGASMLVAQNVIDFEELSLEPESHWNGSDESGSFSSGYVTFYNQYDSGYGSWMGFAYTNETDNTTYSWQNMYSSASGTGVYSSDNYAVSYVGSDWMNNYSPIPSVLKIDTETAPEVIPGMYISLNANSSLYMEADDFYNTGNHWFKLRIIGYSTSSWYFASRDIVMADYRFSNSEDDFKLSDWTYIDMSWAENTDSLVFIILSDDSGNYGVNTPTYFCVDNIGEGLPTGVPQLETEVESTYSIMPGESVELSALARGGVQPYTFSWSDAAGLDDYTSQSPVAGPEATTTWSVTISDATGAESTASVTVWVSGTGIKTNNGFKSEVFVNAAGNISIVSDKVIDNAYVYDLTGKLVAGKEINSTKGDFDLSDLAHGVYIVKTTSGENEFTTKILK